MPPHGLQEDGFYLGTEVNASTLSHHQQAAGWKTTINNRSGARLKPRQIQTAVKLYRQHRQKLGLPVEGAFKALFEASTTTPANPFQTTSAPVSKRLMVSLSAPPSQQNTPKTAVTLPVNPSMVGPIAHQPNACKRFLMNLAKNPLLMGFIACSWALVVFLTSWAGWAASHPVQPVSYQPPTPVVSLWETTPTFGPPKITGLQTSQPVKKGTMLAPKHLHFNKPPAKNASARPLKAAYSGGLAHQKAHKAKPVKKNHPTQTATHQSVSHPFSQSVSQEVRLIKPIWGAPISSGFGNRDGKPHQGVDFTSPVGTRIQAAETGTVQFAGWEQGYGHTVIVAHGHGVKTRYAHCSKVLVRPGQQVQQGQTIARVGMTGHTSGPHLHFEVIKQGIAVNPMPQLHAAPVVANRPTPTGGAS